MKEYTYIKLRVDLKQAMSDDDIEELIEDIDYQVTDGEGRISDIELIEICDY